MQLFCNGKVLVPSWKKKQRSFWQQGGMETVFPSIRILLMYSCSGVQHIIFHCTLVLFFLSPLFLLYAYFSLIISYVDTAHIRRVSIKFFDASYKMMCVSLTQLQQLSPFYILPSSTLQRSRSFCVRLFMTSATFFFLMVSTLSNLASFWADLIFGNK